MRRTTYIATAVILVVAVAATAAIINLQSRVTDTRTDLAAEQQAKADVQDELADTRTDLAAERQAKADVQDELADTRTDLAAERQAKADLDIRINQLTQDLTTLQEETGTPDRLETRIAELEKEILRLERERQALIPNVQVTPVACTGSMEPVITCLDEIGILTNFKFSDIVKGAVVSYWSPRDNIVSLHRVITVLHDAQGGGRIHVKGDNAEHVEAEWVPSSHVYGYLIAVNQNAFPKKAPLRNQVNAAQEAYKADLATYTQLAIQYCGSLAQAASCGYISLTDHDKLVKAYTQHINTFCAYMDALDDAFEAEGLPRRNLMQWRSTCPAWKWP